MGSDQLPFWGFAKVAVVSVQKWKGGRLLWFGLQIGLVSWVNTLVKCQIYFPNWVTASLGNISNSNGGQGDNSR